MSRVEPAWSDGDYEGRARGIFRTTCRALWGVGITGQQDDVELYACSVVDALRGIIPDAFYDDGYPE